MDQDTIRYFINRLTFFRARDVGLLLKVHSCTHQTKKMFLKYS